MANKILKSLDGVVFKNCLGGQYQDYSFITPDNKIEIDSYEIIDNIDLDMGYPNFLRITRIINCVFKGEFLIRNHYGIEDLTFENCTFEGNTTFNLKDRPFKILNCEFKLLLFINSNGANNFVLNKLILHKSIQFSGNFSPSLKISGIDNLNNNVTVILRDAHFANFEVDQLNIFLLAIENNTYFSFPARIYNSIFSEISVNTTSASNIHIDIKNVKVKNLIYLNNIVPKHFLTISKNSIIDKAIIPLDKMSSTSISDSIIKELSLAGTNLHSCQVNIEKTTIDKLYFKKVINEGQITLREIYIPENGIISIQSSNLGETDFILCNFSKANFEFENSKITEVFLSETDFPKKVRVSNKLNHFQAQLAYGQLSTAYRKQGDSIREAEYQSREVESHYKSIHFKSRDFFTKLNLWLNYISTYFGRWWALGVLFTFVSGAITFYFLIISSKEYTVGIGFNYDVRIVASFLKFMNPLRFLETETLFRINGEKAYINLTAASYFWDYLGRILVAYGFYQTIQAFRRYGRR